MLKSICSTLTGISLKCGKNLFSGSCFSRWRKTGWWLNMCLPQKLYCRLLRSVGTDEAVENHMLESKLELKEVKMSISCFLCVFLHPGHHPVYNTTSCIVSGQGWVGKSIACAIVSTRTISMYVCLSAFVYMCTVCIVGGRGIAFTAHHLHFHTQFVMSVTRQGESWGSHHKKIAASTSQMGEEKGQWLEKGASGVAMWPKQDSVN